VIQKQQESKIRSARVLDGGFSFIVLSDRYALQNAVKLSRPGRGWPSSTDTSACQAKGQAFYHPPKSGMPYLVVTVSPEGVSATAVETKEEARVLASKKTMKVDFEEANHAQNQSKIENEASECRKAV
jgi:hypothetical protein